MLTRKLYNYITTTKKKIAKYENALICISAQIAEEDAKIVNDDHFLYISLVEAKRKIQEKLRKYYHIKNAIEKNYLDNNNIIAHVENNSITSLSYESISINSGSMANLQDINLYNKIFRSRLFFVVKQLPAMFDTLTCVIELAMGVSTMTDSEYKLFDVVPLPLWFKETLPFFLLMTYSIYMWNLCAEYTTENIDEIIEIYNNHGFPRETKQEQQDWPELTVSEEKYAAMLAFVPAVYPMLCNAVAIYNFSNALPQELGFAENINLSAWRGFSVFLTVPVAISTMISTGKAVYQSCRKLFAHQSQSQTNVEEQALIHRFVSEASGFLLGVTGFSQGIIEMYYVVGLTTKASSNEARSVLLAMTILLYGLPESCLRHATGIHAVQELIKKIYAGFNRREFTAFIISSTFSILIAEALRKFFIDMLVNPEILLPVSVPQPLVTTFGIGVFVHETIRSTTYTYPFFYRLPQKILAATHSLKNTFSAIVSSVTCCAKNVSNRQRHHFFYHSLEDELSSTAGSGERKSYEIAH